MNGLCTVVTDVNTPGKRADVCPRPSSTWVMGKFGSVDRDVDEDEFDVDTTGSPI